MHCVYKEEIWKAARTNGPAPAHTAVRDTENAANASPITGIMMRASPDVFSAKRPKRPMTGASRRSTGITGSGTADNTTAAGGTSIQFRCSAVRPLSAVTGCVATGF